MKLDLNCADLLISNVNVYNSYFKKFNNADAYIKDGKFFIPSLRLTDRAYLNTISFEKPELCEEM